MRAEFDQNGLEQGYAHITFFRESPEDPAYAEGDALAVGRYTGTGSEYLCTVGGSWGGKPEGLILGVRPAVSNNTISFELQPAYVDSMEDGVYEACLLGADGQVKARAQMSAYDIAWSGLEGTSTLRNYLEAEKPEPAKTKAAEAYVPEVPLAGPNTEEPITTPPEENVVEAADTWEPAPPVVEQATEEKQAEPKTKNRIPLIAAAVVVVLLLVGAAFFLMRGGDSQPTAPQEQSAEQKAEVEKKAAEEAARAEAEKKAAEEAARAEAEKKAAEQAARTDARGRVAKFFSGERNPESAMKLAEELDASTTEQQDALFRLYYYAAGEGHPEAARRYAECVDPSRPAWGTIQKDGAEAWYYYGKAQDGENARARLKQWVEQAAAKGDTAAAKWLQEMK